MTLAPSQTNTITMPRPSDVAHLFAPKRPSIADEWPQLLKRRYVGPGLTCNCSYFGAVPNPDCDDHGYIYDVRTEDDLYPPFTNYDWYCNDCDFGRLPSIRCYNHGHIFDDWKWLGSGDNELPYDIEDNPEAEHDFVETHSKLTSRDIELDHEDGRHYRAGRRQAVNRLPRVKRRDATVNQRSCYRNITPKNNTFQDDLTWWLDPIYI